MAHPLILEVRPLICMARPLIASTIFYFQVVFLEVILVVHFGGTKRARPLITPTFFHVFCTIFYQKGNIFEKYGFSNEMMELFLVIFHYFLLFLVISG